MKSSPLSSSDWLLAMLYLPLYSSGILSSSVSVGSFWTSCSGNLCYDSQVGVRAVLTPLIISLAPGVLLAIYYSYSVRPILLAGIEFHYSSCCYLTDYLTCLSANLFFLSDSLTLTGGYYFLLHFLGNYDLVPVSLIYISEFPWERYCIMGSTYFSGG